MHFISGGAFNGKRAWVKNTCKACENKQWVSAYDNYSLPKELPEIDDALVILEGVEIWLKDLTAQYDADMCREIWNNCLEKWLSWEQAVLNRQLILIGTDITKGIVPM